MILEILPCIHVVIIFAFPDLGKNSFSNSLLGIFHKGIFKISRNQDALLSNIR